MAKRNERSLLNYFRPSRNHLIVIASLMAVACFSCGLALALGASHLDQNQKWFLIFFLSFFSFFSIIFCTWLILRHSRELAVVQKDDTFSWQIMLPETQRRKMNTEVRELAAVLGIPAQQISDLRSAYIVAEDLALRQLEQETKIPVVRHVTIEGAEFDGIMVNRDIVTCIDTTFLVTSHLSQEKISTILKKVDFATKKLNDVRPGSKFRLLLALVTQLDQEGEARLRSTLISKFSATPVDVDIRLLDFEGLQRIFATD